MRGAAVVALNEGDEPHEIQISRKRWQISRKRMNEGDEPTQNTNIQLVQVQWLPQDNDNDNN